MNNCIHIFKGRFGFCLGNISSRDKNRSRDTLLAGGYFCGSCDGGLDQSGGDADERGRWRDEPAETGKAGTKANRTKGNRMGAYSGKNTWRSFWSNPLFSAHEETTSQEGEADCPPSQNHDSEPPDLTPSSPSVYHAGQTRPGGGASMQGGIRTRKVKE